MSDRNYEYFKKLFDKVKPIRGRSVEVRPIGERRRDWEQVTRKDLGDGQFAYCATLHKTDVVEYHPNGDVVVHIGGWATPTTAEFIHIHSPFSCFKQNNKLWVRTSSSSTEEDRNKLYPLGSEPVRFKWVGYNDYKPDETFKIKKQVVNRKKAKAARQPVVAFLAWTKAFLTMSDGWVMHETRKQVVGWDERANKFKYPFRGSDKQIYEKLLSLAEQPEPEAEYLHVLCSSVDVFGYTDRRVAERVESAFEWQGRTMTHNTSYYDFKLDFARVKRRIYAWIEKFGDIHDVVEVDSTSKPLSKVV